MDIQRAEEELILHFNALDDWMARYDYLMMIGISMPRLGKEECTSANLISGCRSKAWIDIDKKSDLIYLKAYSPSFIVCGILAVFIQLLDGHTCNEILKYKPHFFHATGLDLELGQDRNAGTQAILEKIKSMIKEKM